MAKKTPMVKTESKKGKPPAERLVWVDALFGDVDEVVAARGKEAARDDEKRVVSMRCRRHKRRFNVEKGWLRVSRWLCPHCFEALSESDRERYAPRDKTTDPGVRAAEMGKPTMLPRKPIEAKKTERPVEKKSDRPKSKSKVKDESKVECQPRKAEAGKPVSAPPKETRAEPKKVLKYKPEVKAESGEVRIDELGIVEVDEMPVSEGMEGMSDAIRALLPPYRMRCKRCRHIVPVHKDYILHTSRLLCPSCYAEIGDGRAKKFSARFSKMNAELFKIRSEEERRKDAEAKENRREIVIPSWIGYSEGIADNGESDAIAVERRCDDRFIMNSSEQELLGAVASGRVSKVRARIELARRRHKAYYNGLPEVEPIPVMF